MIKALTVAISYYYPGMTHLSTEGESVEYLS